MSHFEKRDPYESCHVPANLVPDRPPSKTASCDDEEDEEGGTAAV